MLDELLGRSELKARIEELEEEKRRLEERLEAEGERRSEAVTARQAAEERVNRLEDRVEELEDRVERLGGDAADLDYRGVESLRGSRLDDVLARLRSVDAGREGAMSAAVVSDRADDLPEAVEAAFGDRAPLVAEAAPCLAYADDAGLVSVALAPPLPPEPFAQWADGFRVDDAPFRPTDEFGFALVRADLFAYGEYDGSEFASAAGFESDVMNRHSKGGFSQARFERRREDQVDEHLDRCREAIAERRPDRLIVVGDRRAVRELRDLADHTAVSDASGDPDEALTAAFRDFWTTRLYRV
ncbi:Vms1/Ankzf1 family peptidyl-tRNA hydrolase [Halobium salinum]|uniref:Vms1/Ankzf1 family peptidyl-tRNA hydrolase n=1 Tax=Halobium salinum TaxID=1364940 RepID=A0ABD5P9M0_9EURY|nr:Vms1/Ankzf1 family peptidyl-tRNA hydrolase [Halobium salinum]